jgi:hypothetical protein
MELVYILYAYKLIKIVNNIWTMVLLTKKLFTIETDITVSMDLTLDFYKIPAEYLLSVEQVCLYKFENMRILVELHAHLFDM